jgi:hypothetical protein
MVDFLIPNLKAEDTPLELIKNCVQNNMSHSHVHIHKHEGKSLCILSIIIVITAAQILAEFICSLA